MTDREPPSGRTTPSLEDVAARLAAAQAREADKTAAASRRKGKAEGIGIGMRIGIELVASVLVGAGLGWFFDDRLHTSPIFLLALLALGFAAGVLNVIRLTKRMDLAQGIVHGANDNAKRPKA
jgi:ATP synthase protein I